MDSHQPADPWGIPEGPADDAEGVVATASKEPRSGLLGRPVDPEPVELPEPPAAETAVDEVDEPDQDEPTLDEAPEATDSQDQEPVAEWTDEESQIDVAIDPEDVAVEPELEEPVVEATAVVDEGPKFDLGLDEDTSGDWGEPVGDFDSGTAFDLIPPSSDGEEAPQYEVEEPDLSDAFVATSPEGRPDVGTPHLMDPDPLMAVPEETHPELSTSDEPEDEPASPFRLPGLFGRRKPVEEPEPIEVEEPAAEIDEPATLEEPLDEVDDAPPMPSAWGETPSVGSDDPANPFGDWTQPETEDAEADVTDDEPEADDEPATDEEPEAAVQDEQDHLVAELENVLELPVEAPAEAAEAEGEDTMEIELTEPDLSELVDAEQLYVTEEAHEDRPPALLTVDSVPGATIAQAVDVVTAVASASSETEIADAMDRVLGQLRDKAHDLGGEAVISVHTEVQEMGGGFLVTGSGTAVTLA